MGTESKQSNSMVLMIIAILMAGICGLLGVGIGYYITPSRSTPTPETSEQTQIPEPSPTYDITPGGILRRIETTSILQTTVYRIDSVVRAKKEGSWFFNWGGQNIILFVQGKVTAGIDLSELKESDIEVSPDNRTVTITLPPVKILDATLDEYTVETFEGEKPENVDFDLLQNGLEQGKLKIEEIACTDRILERASLDSENVFSDMIRLIDFGDYVI